MFEIDILLATVMRLKIGKNRHSSWLSTVREVIYEREREGED